MAKDFTGRTGHQGRSRGGTLAGPVRPARGGAAMGIEHVLVLINQCIAEEYTGLTIQPKSPYLKERYNDTEISVLFVSADDVSKPNEESVRFSMELVARISTPVSNIVDRFNDVLRVATNLCTFIKSTNWVPKRKLRGDSILRRNLGSSGQKLNRYR